MQEEVTHLQEEYWFLHSNIDSWQFWVMLLMLVIPLIVLYFAIDKRKDKLFLILFYGFNIHVWFTYIDSIGVRHGYWTYPYYLTPYFPFSFSLDSSLIPVAFLLVYQWTLNYNKNFYLYSIGLSIIIAFGLKPLLDSANLFELNKGMNYFYLFLLYCFIFILSKLIIEIFLKIQKRAE
ncbi:hypothetical protein D0466_19900 [Peribacillus glennii]|uniref:Uncharacterized protein n=2 Tax=Peribacillus glennii TaxID=2303991 RepID=A0A372L865_9BACI|nr:hypothetical protein D0466_19900 [Peribacillus glennii]